MIMGRIKQEDPHKKNKTWKTESRGIKLIQSEVHEKMPKSGDPNDRILKAAAAVPESCTVPHQFLWQINW